MKTLLDRFLNQAEQHPNRLALIEKSGATTYGELLKRVNEMAFWLRDRGVKPGDHVALILDNNTDYVAAYYGAWFIGAVPIALNTALKEDDWQHLIKHCEAVLLVTHSQFLKPTKALAANHVILVDQLEQNESRWQEQSVESASAHQSELSQLATIIYTSGTTGHPKGVMLSHRNLVANVDAIIDYLKLSYQDKTLCVLPFFYSYGNSVLHTHLACGASLVLENSFVYPVKVLENMVAERVTGFSGVPTTFLLLNNRTSLGDFDLSSLRYVTQAGGAMAPEEADNFLKHVPNAEFCVMYGQTEASARLTYLPPAKREAKRGSVGIPVSGVTIKIFDEQDVEVSAGQQGQICARGDNIMQGYWRDVEETENVLRNGWLHTGDIGYKDEDGFIYIVGRNREMIKSGAHRIAPQEIEEKIALLNGVLEVAVFGMPDSLLGQAIWAAIIPQQGETLLKKDVMKHCRDILALYKMPKEVIFMDAFPKTASGKVKKHELLAQLKR